SVRRPHIGRIAQRSGYSGSTSETPRYFFPLREESLRHIRLECLEEFLLVLEFFLPFVRFDREELAHRFAGDIDLREIKVFRPRNRSNLRFRAAAVTFA